MRIVTWCRLSGDSDQKSHIAVLERRFVLGWRFCVWMKSGNLSGSRTRRVVADDVPIALFGIETQRKPAHVALGVGGTALAGDGGEAQERLGLLADAGERLDLSVPRHVPADGQRAKGAGALRVNGAFRDALAVLMGELLE
jgi:hypothetical protein